MLKNLSLIVAMNQDRVIGVNNQLPWHIPEDLAYFKTVTLSKTIIMGRKTFESIGRILPNRQHIILTRDKSYKIQGAEVVSNLEAALKLIKHEDEAFIIGGAEIFNQTVKLVNKLYITIVDIKINHANAYFPTINYNQFNLIKQNDIISATGIKCSFRIYNRCMGLE